MDGYFDPLLLFNFMHMPVWILHGQRPNLYSHILHTGSEQ